MRFGEGELACTRNFVRAVCIACSVTFVLE